MSWLLIGKTHGPVRCRVYNTWFVRGEPREVWTQSIQTWWHISLTRSQRRRSRLDVWSREISGSLSPIGSVQCQSDHRRRWLRVKGSRLLPQPNMRIVICVVALIYCAGSVTAGFESHDGAAPRPNGIFMNSPYVMRTRVLVAVGVVNWTIAVVAGAGLGTWTGRTQLPRCDTACSPQDSADRATGQFGLSLIATSDGKPAKIDSFFMNETCGVCHERQLNELQGSMHSVAHEEPLYRWFAELARKEAGEPIYTYCSSCHSPAGVVSGLIPTKRDPELPAEAKAGVTCDVCHQISVITGLKGPWHEEGNGSFAFQLGRTKYGSRGDVVENRAHTGAKREIFARSEYCASCHTVIHPANGLRIENTYDEWKSSVYAKNGIQCQDCHMRSVEDSVKVAEELKPVVRFGESATGGPMREIHSHWFVGGNANADRLANGSMHAEQAEARLKSAARVELIVPKRVTAGNPLKFEVLVHNIAAGHNLPTGITELREMWLDILVKDVNGAAIFRSGGLDEDGEVCAGAISFGAVGGDAAGNKTVKPWEMTRFLTHRTVPPKGFTRDPVNALLPLGTASPITVEVKLLYRSAPAWVAKEVMPDGTLVPKIIEMARASATLSMD